MKETIGNRVGVYRTTMRREVLRLPILIALVTALAVVLNLGKGDRDTLFLVKSALFAYAAACGLVFAGLWLHTLIWRVTLFEGGLRGPTYSLGFRTLAWGEISSAKRMPFHLQSISPFHAALQLQAHQGSGIWIYEPLVGMQEFKGHVRRLAGEEHPFTRLLHER